MKTDVEEPLVVASPAYLSPLVKQLTSIEQCREWEQVEQHKKIMMGLLQTSLDKCEKVVKIYEQVVNRS